MPRAKPVRPPTSPSGVFAIALQDELWIEGEMVERRHEHGLAIDRGDRIDAADTADLELVELAERPMPAMRQLAGELRDARVRLMSRAVREGGIQKEATITVTIEGVAIVTDQDWCLTEASRLRKLMRVEPEVQYAEPLPMVWLGGSGAVLLHEAAGHAAEQGMPLVPWPEWLRTRDLSGSGEWFDLLAGEAPRTMRRTSFRDLPLPRMSNLFASPTVEIKSVPERRIEIHHPAGGSFDPLTDMVTVHIAVADLVEGNRRRRLEPFTIRASRRSVAASFIGAYGRQVRYPGVICSSEGQDLLVSCYAGVFVTAPLDVRA